MILEKINTKDDRKYESLAYGSGQDVEIRSD